jgi:NAD(P)-dependent dehydrogenase (short-subunit alcohol dehydrogenase family)
MMHTALITGGARRLGREMALHLARSGWNVGIHYFQSGDDAESLSDELNQLGSKVALFQRDLSKADQAGGLIDACQAELGHLSLLINNASIFTPSDFNSSTIETMQANVNIHAFSPWILMREFKQVCQEGLIVNMLDTRIEAGRPDYLPYILSKQMLAELTRVAAMELSPGVRVNGIAPGAVLPPEGANKDHISKVLEGIPAGRFGDPRNIVSALAFLLENDYINGQILHIDGGESIPWQ